VHLVRLASRTLLSEHVSLAMVCLCNLSLRMHIFLCAVPTCCKAREYRTDQWVQYGLSQILSFHAKALHRGVSVRLCMGRSCSCE
ncbi:hypothetical protein COO60DRAFT_1560578, partial [Scenedesmus sp. NREL 46B-D3]